MSEVIARPDLVSPEAPAGTEVIQLTSQETNACHIYMEAQVFTPDSRRLVLHRSATPHGGDKDDPKHQYLLCDLDEDCALSPLTDELGPTAPSISPDGRCMYYFVDETEPGGGKLMLKRVNLDGSDRQTLFVLDTPIPGTGYCASRLYPLSSIRSDGRKLALSCFLGDGKTPEPPWGLMVFDLENPSVELILSGPTWCNIHPQYSRSADAEEMRDILVQENHGNESTPTGGITRLVGGVGADIHVIRDDGTDFRNMPWGRDGNESCQGHQCWRGESAWAITSTGTREPAEEQLIEGRETAHADHVGLASPGAVRNDLSRSFGKPHFYHFATDRRGERFITDTGPNDQGGRVFVADLGEPGRDALSGWTCIADPHSSWQKGAHIHPFLSPDGKAGFFNSDETGRMQAYMVRGF